MIYPKLPRHPTQNLTKLSTKNGINDSNEKENDVNIHYRFKKYSIAIKVIFKLKRNFTFNDTYLKLYPTGISTVILQIIMI